MESFDSDPDEVIISSHGKSVIIYNSIGTEILKNYKVTNIPPKCLAVLGDDYFISCSANIPEIKIWPVRDERKIEKHPCGIVSSLSTSTCGTYCVAAFQTEIRIWNVLNGAMLSSFVAHYQDITCLRFTSDDAYFISGGKDGFVKVWVLSTMISVSHEPEKEPPLYSWNHHSIEVTDIFTGSLGIHSRVVTSSLDMTCKVYELQTGVLLSTLCLDKAVTAVIADPLDYYIIAGTEIGKIHKINTYYELPSEAHSNTMQQEEFTAHKSKISCLSMSFSGDKFLSTSTDGLMKIWEMSTLTQIFSLKSSEAPFENAFFFIGPSSLFNNYEPSITPRPLQRCFIPRNQKNPLSSSMPLRPGNRDLSEIHVEDTTIDDLPVKYSDGDDPIPVKHLNAREKAELFQQVTPEETIDEVREMNSQMYTFILDQMFQSMGDVERAERPIQKNSKIQKKRFKQILKFKKSASSTEIQKKYSFDSNN